MTMLWPILDHEPSEDEIIFYNLMLNLEYYGNPAGPCLFELPPKGGTTHAL